MQSLSRAQNQEIMWTIQRSGIMITRMMSLPTHIGLTLEHPSITPTTKINSGRRITVKNIMRKTMMICGNMARLFHSFGTVIIMHIWRRKGVLEHQDAGLVCVILGLGGTSRKHSMAGSTFHGITKTLLIYAAARSKLLFICTIDMWAHALRLVDVMVWWNTHLLSTYQVLAVLIWNEEEL